MLMRCAKCGKPVYAAPNSQQAECRYCFATSPTWNLAPLKPSELDWRRPLYDAATFMPPGEASLQRFSALGDYTYVAQRIDLCNKETGMKSPGHSPDKADHSTACEGHIAHGNLPFCYDSNPFHVLEATPRDTRSELAVLQRDAMLFGNDQAASEAFDALSHPQSRLEAEISWFPQAMPAEIDELLRFLQTPRQPYGSSVIIPEMPSMVAQFNAVRLLLSTEPIENAWDFEAHILSISVLADGLYAEQVREEINADRAQAGFAQEMMLSPVNAQLNRLLAETLSHVIARKPPSLAPRSVLALSKHLEKAYRNELSTYYNSYFLELASDLLSDL